MFAAHERLDNLVAIVDRNGLQIDGACTEVMCLGEIEAKFAAFGWEVATCDGHDIASIIDSIRRVREVPLRPGVVVAATTKGKGVSFMEDEAGWHGRAPSAEETEAALCELQAALAERGAAR
jgi:transketolase